MNKKYITPVTDIVEVNLHNSVLGTGDAAASGGADGGDGLVNTIDFDDEPAAPTYEYASKPSLWD